MQIVFSPQRSDQPLIVVKAGDSLTINGEVFDFTSLPDGAEIPAGGVPCEWIVGPVQRIDGKINLTLLFPHGPNPSLAVAFPEAIDDAQDGPITLPGGEVSHVGA
ncbi:hypothetical protein [Shinella sp. M31]|uniref:hypothetical protein n=1 Tax=Shinella sp. M31 TaxID=3368615 RepID=UPI003BA3CD94